MGERVQKTTNKSATQATTGASLSKPVLIAAARMLRKLLAALIVSAVRFCNFVRLAKAIDVSAARGRSHNNRSKGFGLAPAVMHEIYLP
jgi:hypothetical protein